MPAEDDGNETKYSSCLHEAGHATLLLSCGDKSLELDAVRYTGSEAYGESTLATTGYRFTNPVVDIGGIARPSARSTAAALALMSMGGMSAQLLFGANEDVLDGADSDLRDLFFYLAVLTEADDRVLATFSVLFDPDGSHAGDEHEDHRNQLLEYLNTLLVKHGGGGLGETIKAVGDEANRRLAMSKAALHAIASQLEEKEVMSADEILLVLEQEGWCGVLGPPCISGLFDPSCIPS